MNQRCTKGKMVVNRGIGPKACSNAETKAGFTAAKWLERLDSSAWIGCLALTILLPWPGAKVAAGFALLISLRTFNSLTRSQGIALLGGLFALAYLFSPYGLISSMGKSQLPSQVVSRMPTAIAMSCALFIIGSAWAWLAAGEIAIVADRKRKITKWQPELIAAVILAAFVLALNYAPLHYTIPVYGDEDHHTGRVQMLHYILQPFFTGDKAIVTAVVFGLVVGFLFCLRCITAHIKLLIVCAIGLIACLKTGFLGTANLKYLLIRYPLFSCWFHQLGPIWSANMLDEGMYRLVPMVSAFAIGWFVMWALRKEGAGIAAAVIFGLAFALTPSIYFYSTILYLELPAVVLLVVALYFIEPILKNDFESVRCCPGWYALMVVGFIKETLAVMIFGIIGLRLLVRAWIVLKEKGLNKRVILHEVAAVFCIVTPLGVYLFLRMYFGDVRGYQPLYVNLTNVRLYSVAGKALWAQFGGVLILAVCGLFVGLLQRRLLVIVALTLLLVSQFFFHFMEYITIIAFARFQLFLFGPLVVLAIIFLTWLAGKSRAALLVAALACLIINLALSPVAITGEKKPAWASPMRVKGGESEYYFPYEDAVNWLKTNRPNWPVLIGGTYCNTNGLDWSFAKANYRPKIILVKVKGKTPYMDALKVSIATARRKAYPLVLVHKMEGGLTLTEDEKSILGYKAVKILRNHYLAMVVYQAQVGLAPSRHSSKTNK